MRITMEQLSTLILELKTPHNHIFIETINSTYDVTKEKKLEGTFLYQDNKHFRKAT